jgi:hypothetical protein
MSEARFDSVMRELRATAPPAPAELRERVRAMPEPQRRAFGFKLRPALAAAAAIAVAVGIGAAAIQAFTESPDRNREALIAELPGASRVPRQTRYLPANPSTRADNGASSLGKSLELTPLNPGSRLQEYDVSMSVRVDDLSRGTKSAIRTTRRLDGYVAAADYSTGGSTGDSRLDLRVPVQRVQAAIARFTELGTILSQRIAVADLQAGVDSLDRRIGAARRIVEKFAGRTDLTPAERAQLESARRTTERLSRSRARLVRQGTYANISLMLTTRRPAAKQEAPGRFDRFWGDAGDILGKEAIVVLYALVVAGPFVLLAALALLGERARRRRADSRLLEETA